MPFPAQMLSLLYALPILLLETTSYMIHGRSLGVEAIPDPSTL